MDVRLIDGHVGHDGSAFFCLACGKTGFKSVAAVRGHLAFCSKGRVLPSVGVAVGAGAGAVLRGQKAMSGMVSSSFQAGQAQEVALDDGSDKRYWAMMQDVSQRLDRIEKMLYNEMPHQMAVVQAQQQSFDNKWLKWVIVGYIAIWFLRKLGDDSVVKKAGSKIGDRVLGKAIDGLLDL